VLDSVAFYIVDFLMPLLGSSQAFAAISIGILSEGYISFKILFLKADLMTLRII
jgi:hypothetical protein